MDEAVIRAPEPTEEEASKPPGCWACLREIPPKAKKCGNCGEWLAPTQLRGVDAALQFYGWIWFSISVAVFGWLWLASVNAPAASLYGITPSLWDSVPWTVYPVLMLQSAGVGLLVVSFAQRGPREVVE